MFKPLQKSFSFVLLGTALLALSLQLSAAPQAPDFDFSKQEKGLTKTIIRHLNNEHYRTQEINDEFSANLFDAYLLSLDPQKTYFTQSDLKQLKKHRLDLDQQIGNNNHDAIVEIYNTFYSSYVIKLTDMIENFDDYLPRFTQATTEELVIDPDKVDWPEDEKASIERWLNFVHNDFINLKLADKSNEEARDILVKRYQARLNRVKDLDSSNVYDAFINNLTALYDPHTNWLSPKALENFKIGMSLSLEGIGAVLQKDGEYTKVVRLISGGPAAKQGELAAGNRIIAVAQEGEEEPQDIVGWRLDEVVQLIRGKAGTKVTLQVQDEKESLKIITIQRDQVELEDQAAKKAVIEVPSSNGQTLKIGVINIPAFYMDFDAYRNGDSNFRSTTRDVYKLVRELQDEGVDGLIVDLRNNGGGSLREATTLTDLFIDRGPIVQIRSADDQVSRRYRSQNSPVYTGPLLVYINHFSASASEIFAGAIQDYKRGLIIGEQSYGKGTVQTLSELSSGQLKLTTAKFYRVSGDSTQHRGVVPDIAYPSLLDFNEVGESALDYALPWDQIHNVKHVTYNMPDNIFDKLEKKHQARMENDPEYQHLQERIDYLKEQKEKDAVLLLDLNKRQQQDQEQDEKILSMVNKKREKQKKDLFGSYDDYETYVDDLNAKRNASNEIDLENDFLLIESAAILADFVKMYQEHKSEVAEVPKPDLFLSTP